MWEHGSPAGSSAKVTELPKLLGRWWLVRVMVSV